MPAGSRRERDYAAEYVARKARAAARGSTVYRDRIADPVRRGFTLRQASGHAPEGEVSVSEFRDQRIWHVLFFATRPGGGGELVDVALTFDEAQDAGTYMQMVRALKSHDIEPDEFRQATRRMTIGGRHVVSDPSVALALSLTISSDDLVFDSPRANAGRRT